MLIRVSDDGTIQELIMVGSVNPNTPGYYQIDRSDITEDILQHIEEYRYIDHQFVKPSTEDDMLRQQLIDEKIKHMRIITNQIIEHGIDVGDDHYSLSHEDQMNLTNLSMMVSTGINEVPYHADGKLCRMYSAEEILSIATTGILYITFHTTYFNFMKAHLQSLNDIQEIIQFQYGMSLQSTLMQQVSDIVGNVDITEFLAYTIPDTNDYSKYMSSGNGLQMDEIDFDKASFVDRDELIQQSIEERLKNAESIPAEEGDDDETIEQTVEENTDAVDSVDEDHTISDP